MIVDVLGYQSKLTQSGELPMQQQVIETSHQQTQLAPPRILIVDDQHMPQRLANQLFLRIKYAQLTSVTDINRACDAISVIGCDFVIVNESSQVDKINGYLNENPFNVRLQGIIWITDKEEVSFNPEILRKVRVFVMDESCDEISEKIELVAHGWNGTSH